MEKPSREDIAYGYLECAKVILGSIQEILLEENSLFKNGFVLDHLSESIRHLKNVEIGMDQIIKQSQEPKNVCY
jgi:hypothetical protein